jgi:hypothetical protein
MALFRYPGKKTWWYEFYFAFSGHCESEGHSESRPYTV